MVPFATSDGKETKHDESLGIIKLLAVLFLDVEFPPFYIFLPFFTWVAPDTHLW